MYPVIANMATSYPSMDPWGQLPAYSGFSAPPVLQTPPAAAGPGEREASQNLRHGGHSRSFSLLHAAVGAASSIGTAAGTWAASHHHPQSVSHQGGHQHSHYVNPPQQYQQQHQHKPSAHHAGAASAAAVVVVDARYCSAAPTQLVLQEHMGLLQKDDFSVTDAHGRMLFRQDAKAFSMGSKRTLLDAYGQPAVSMERKLVSIHGTWVMYRGGAFSAATKVAVVKPALVSLKPCLRVYLNDGDSREDFTVSGNFRARKFEIRQVGIGRDRVLARVHKESRFSSTTAFIMASLTDADKYFVSIEPGVDAAFVVALATLVDEVFQDGDE